MIKSAHVEPLLCPFNGLPFCTLVPMGILNASSLYCQPDHVPTLIYTFQWPSITLRLKPKVLSIGLPQSGSLLPLWPQFHPLCASFFQSGLFSVSWACRIHSCLRAFTVPSAGNTVPQICTSLSLFPSLFKCCVLREAIPDQGFKNVCWVNDCLKCY